MWPLDEPTTIGRAILFGAGGFSGSALASPGVARPAATAAVAPRNSRRVGAMWALSAERRNGNYTLRPHVSLRPRPAPPGPLPRVGHRISAASAREAGGSQDIRDRC